MGRESVLPRNGAESTEELVALGRDQLLAFQREAGERLANLERTYGRDHRGARHSFVPGLERDIAVIRKALQVIDEREGTSYRPRVAEKSREEIAERLASAQRAALLSRSDEGVDEHDSRHARSALDAAQREANALALAGYPLSSAELSAAELRVADRQFRMKYGIRRIDERMICTRCRATILAGTVYCSYCGELVGSRPPVTIFVSYAAEDHASIVAPLIVELRKTGVSFWYDREEIQWGDSIVEKVNEGIKKSAYVLVVLTRTFLRKPWPRRELNAVLSLDAGGRGTHVLPLIAAANSEEKAEILSEFALGSDKLYVEWKGSATEIVAVLQRRLAAI